MLKKNDNNKNLRIPTGDLPFVLGMNVYQGQNCVEAWAEVGFGQIIELLNAVRNRILDFSLALWKDDRLAGELPENSKNHIKQSKVTQIFNTTIYGGSANLVGTAIESSIAFNIIKNDFPSLERELINQGISPEDVSELNAAVISDPNPESKNKFGPKVSEWIAKMMGKAAEGSWKIGIGAAGSFLAQAIAKYYGLS